MCLVLSSSWRLSRRDLPHSQIMARTASQSDSGTSLGSGRLPLADEINHRSPPVLSVAEQPRRTTAKPRGKLAQNRPDTGQL